ncbi:hypothetical protein YC2023_061895 [Brassica napus]
MMWSFVLCVKDASDNWKMVGTDVGNKLFLKEPSAKVVTYFVRLHLIMSPTINVKFRLARRCICPYKKVRFPPLKTISSIPQN